MAVDARSDLLAAGEAALERGAWAQARAVFEGALALGGLVRVGQGEVAAGMAQLDEATAAATAGEMRDSRGEAGA